MKDIEKYSDQDLKNELSRREMERYEINGRKLPEQHYQYEEVESLSNGEKQYFAIYVNDGCEGMDYLVEVDCEDGFDSYDELTLLDTVKHHIISKANKEKWDDQFYVDNVEMVYEVGRYSRTFLKINVPEEKYDDE